MFSQIHYDVSDKREPLIVYLIYGQTEVGPMDYQILCEI